MNKKTVYITSIINLIFISFIFFDNILPHDIIEKGKLNSIYGFSNKISERRGMYSPVFDDKIILELANDNRYRLGFNPENDKFINGKEIKVYKSIIFNNVNFLEIYHNGHWKRYYCGLLRNYTILFPFIFSILFSLLSFRFFENKFIHIGLVASIMFLPIQFFIYIYYF